MYPSTVLLVTLAAPTQSASVGLETSKTSRFPGSDRLVGPVATTTVASSPVMSSGRPVTKGYPPSATSRGKTGFDTSNERRVPV